MTVLVNSPQSKLDFVRCSVRGKYLACLLHNNKHFEIGQFFQRIATNEGHTREHFYLALSLAYQGIYVDALDIVRSVIKKYPDHIEAKDLCYAILLQIARTETRQENWDEIPELVAEAKGLATPDRNFGQDFSAIIEALPFALLSCGDRKGAIEKLELRFLEDPTNTQILHSLSLALLWGATGSKEPRNPSFFSPEEWVPAILYWNLLRNQKSFWETWAEERERIWGFKLPPEECQTIQAKFLEEQFEHVFRDGLDSARQAKDGPGIKAYLFCLETLYLEIKSATVWQRALKRAAHTTPLPILAEELCKEADAPMALAPLLVLPGGFGFLSRHGLSKAPAALAKRLETKSSDRDLAGDLLLLFAESGLGRIKVLIEDLGLPEDAANLLTGKFPDHPAAIVYLKSYAQLHVAEQALLHKENAKALDYLKRAWTGSRQSGVPSHLALSARIRSLHEEVETKFIAAILKDAKDSSDSNQRELAIKKLEESVKLMNNSVLIDHLCNYLCNLAQTFLNDDQCLKARLEAEKTLTYKNGHPLARQIMGRAFNREGVMEKDPEKASRNYERALEWTPNNPIFMQNLALAYRALAVKNINKVLQPNVYRNTVLQVLNTEITRLEKAYSLANCKNEYKADCPNTVKIRAQVNADYAKSWVANIGDENIKDILEVLADAYEIQKNRSRL